MVIAESKKWKCAVRRGSESESEIIRKTMYYEIGKPKCLLKWKMVMAKSRQFVQALDSLLR